MAYRRKHLIVLEIETCDSAVAKQAKKAAMHLGGSLAAPTGVKVTVHNSDSAIGPQTVMERVRGDDEQLA